MIGVDQDASSLEAAERTVAEAKLTLNSYTDFENFYDFKPTGQHETGRSMIPELFSALAMTASGAVTAALTAAAGPLSRVSPQSRSGRFPARTALLLTIRGGPPAYGSLP